jgi:hypothetical protein
MTDDLPTYIAATIAESRVKKVREALRDKLLQRAQLEDGRLVDMADGVISNLVECPACATLDPNFGEFGAGSIEVLAPFGVEAGEMAQPSSIKVEALKDDVILWAVRSGIFKVTVNNSRFDALAAFEDEETRYMMSAIGSSLKARTTDVLRVINPEKLRGEG